MKNDFFKCRKSTSDLCNRKHLDNLRHANVWKCMINTQLQCFSVELNRHVILEALKNTALLCRLKQTSLVQQEIFVIFYGKMNILNILNILKSNWEDLSISQIKCYLNFQKNHFKLKMSELVKTHQYSMHLSVKPLKY